MNLAAHAILEEVMQFRRLPASGHTCDSTCEACLEPHLSKVISAIKENAPITFILPAFPGKSPNHSKVLGPLPDMAEQRSLEFLENLCLAVRKHHAPGARIILCSDGRVFSDAVGLMEENVSAYQRELDSMIKKLNLTCVSIFNLDDIHEGLSFEEMRAHLMEKYGRSMDLLKDMVREGKQENSDHETREAHRLYCGITRFLFEDAMVPGQTKTRSSIQKDCRSRAYEVIRRSNAWSELLAEVFPDAVRLSIHPQICGAKKLGIRLLQADNWMTPWHGVAVERNGEFVLLHRSKAEAMGAELIEVGGVASHYKIS